MREKINALANGNISYELPRLILSQEKLVCAVEAGKKQHGRVTLTNSLERPMKGFVCSDHPAMELISSKLVGVSVNVEYVVHGEYLTEKDSAAGELSFITDCGEIALPFRIEVVTPALFSSDGEIRNLQQFAVLAKNHWEKAVALFAEPSFRSFLEYHEPRRVALWEHLNCSSSRNQALEEFLVKTGQKMEVSFQVDEKQLRYEAGEQDFIDRITVTKNNWGYLQIHVSASEPFLIPEQEEITAEQFHGGSFDLRFRVLPDRMNRGKHFAALIFETRSQRVEIPVACHRAQERPLEFAAKQEKKRLYVKLLENHLQYAMNRIPTGRYVSEAEGLLTKFERLEAETLEQRLYRVYLYRLAGKESAANGTLRLITEDERKEGGVCNQAFYLFLKAERSQSNKAELMEQLYRLCNEHPEQPTLGLLLLRLDERYARNSRMKLDELRNLFENGCESPLLYLQAAQIYNSDPSLLHELEPFAVQAVAFAVKRGIAARELAQQFAYLVEKAREYSPLYYRILSELYDRYPCREILGAICYMLIREGRREPKYAVWYQRGVQEQLRIAELYEYYMYTVETDVEQQLDPAILMYFVYNSRLSDSRLAFLYANVVCHKESNRPVYDTYREKVHAYAMSQMRAGNNSRHLAILYNDCLFDPETRTEALAYLPRVAFRCEVECANPAMRYVCVAHQELQEESLAPLVNGTAQVDIYTEHVLISLVDDGGNRHVTGIPYRMTRLLHAEDCYNDAYRLSPESNLLLLHLAAKAQAESKFDAASVELRKQAIRLSEVSEAFRGELVRTLVLYFYDNFQDEMLGEYMTELKEREIPRKQRAKILSLFIIRGQYERALSMLRHFGSEEVDPRLVETFCISLPQELQRQYEEAITGLMYWAFAQGRRNEKLMKHLVANYQGPTLAMYHLWQEAYSMGLATADMEERLLAQMLFTESYLTYADQVFAHYQRPGSNRQLIRAYLTYVSYKYLLGDVPIGEQTAAFMKRDVYIDENDVCILALLRMSAEQDELNAEEQSFAEYWLLRMEAKGKVLPSFCRLSRYFKLPESLEDKVLIEYRTNPKNRVTLHYTFRMNGKRRQQDYPMRNICHGIFIKELVLFEGETIEYVISEEDGKNSVVSEKTVLTGEMGGRDPASRFGKINAIIAARKAEDKEKALELLNAYVKDSFAVSQLFHEMLN